MPEESYEVPEPFALGAATEPDEETILADLYGEPDKDGVYRGEEVADGGDR